MKKIVTVKDIDNIQHNYTIIAENNTAVLGFDSDSESNKNTFALFPKNKSGEIITEIDNISYGLFANNVSDLNIDTTFSLEEIININHNLEQLSQDIEVED